MELFDFHCDTLYECCEAGKRLRENDLAVNRAAAATFSHYAQFFALFCGAKAPEGAGKTGRRCLLDLPPDERFSQMLQTAQREFADNADWLMQCRSAQELEEARAAGKAAAFLSIEGAELLPEREDALEMAYDAGVRLITLTWNYQSRFGCPSCADTDTGLTELGCSLVRECEERGILLDVSHLSERGFWDLCEVAKKPFVASHSNAYALCKHKRNLTDAQFAEIVRRGGVVGLNLYTPFLVHQSDCTLDDVLYHIEHFLGMYGEPHLALGCDWDGCEIMPAGIRGLADIGKLAERMLQAGYKESTVKGLFYDNLYAFIKKML